jgi:hypothetical protein
VDPAQNTATVARNTVTTAHVCAKPAGRVTMLQSTAGMPRRELGGGSESSICILRYVLHHRFSRLVQSANAKKSPAPTFQSLPRYLGILSLSTSCSLLRMAHRSARALASQDPD